MKAKGETDAEFAQSISPATEIAANFHATHYTVTTLNRIRLDSMITTVTPEMFMLLQNTLRAFFIIPVINPQGADVPIHWCIPVSVPKSNHRLYVSISDGQYSDTCPLPLNFPNLYGGVRTHIVSWAKEEDVKNHFFVK